MPSKFESKLFPSIARITTAVSLAFVGAVYFVSTRGTSNKEQPFRDVYSPDGLFVASIEHNSQLNLSARPAHGTRWNLAEGEDRIVDAKWITPRRLEVDILPGDPSGPGDPSELPRQRSQFGDVRISYHVISERIASR